MQENSHRIVETDEESVRQTLGKFGFYSKSPVDYKNLAEELGKCAKITHVYSYSQFSMSDEPQ